MGINFPGKWRVKKNDQRRNFSLLHSVIADVNIFPGKKMHLGERETQGCFEFLLMLIKCFVTCVTGHCSILYYSYSR